VSLQQRTLELVSTYTDASGNYTFDNLPTGSSTIVVTASGYQNAAQGAYVVSNQTLTDNFQLEQNPATVTGTVTEAATGTPIAGAFIKIMQGSVTFASTMTDNLGRYSITGMSPNTYNVRASCNGYQTNLQTTTLVAGQTNTVDFSLSTERGSVSGSIQDASHNPVPWTTVRALQNNNVLATTRTGLDGLYTLTGLAPGDYIIRATATNLQVALQPATVTDGHTTIADFILLPNPGKISGVITDDYTGAVLPGVKTLVMQNGNVYATFFTDSNGFYTLVNLAPGQYTVTAIGPAIYQVAVVTVDVLADQNSVQNISLFRRPGSIYGQALDAVSHTAVSGVEIVALSGSTVVASTTTDGSGMYTIASLSPGSYIIRASGSSAYQIATQEAFVQSDVATEVNFLLQRNPGILTGRVKDSSTKKPIRMAHITVWSHGTLIASTSTNSHGVYTINNLPPGRYKVKASKGAAYTPSTKTARIVSLQQTTLSFHLTPRPLPPNHIRGHVKRRSHGHNYRKYKYTIRWKRSCSHHVRGYYVYRDGKHIATISKEDELEYKDCHKRRKDHRYCVRAINSLKELSIRVCITLE
jgi:protocatechuate 3,4-dioxygenase beta subunit